MDRLRVGASIDKTPVQYARDQGHDAMTAWLERIQRVGWKRYLSGPRYKLVGLRLLVARGRAQRQHPFFGKEQLMDLLFPGDQPLQPTSKQGVRACRTSSSQSSPATNACGGLTAREQAAAAADKEEAAARAAWDIPASWEDY